jgi:hypothetical protein
MARKDGPYTKCHSLHLVILRSKIDTLFWTMMGVGHGNASSNVARSSLRRSLRFRRRFLLLTLLAVACSPSLLALYLISGKGSQRSADDDPEHTNQHQPPPSTIAQQPQSLEECAASSSSIQCCSPWSINTDDWWTTHSDGWELAPLDNATHTCFTRVRASTPKGQFLQALHHQQQWPPKNYDVQQEQLQQQCSTVLQVPQISSGYAAALMAVARSFYAAFQAKRPFQITRAHAAARWNFSPRPLNTSSSITSSSSSSATEQQHWAYCETQDMNCYYLPLSPCPAVIGQNNGERGDKPATGMAKDEFRWLRQYAARPRHVVRWHLQQYMMQQKQLARLQPCTAIHVRRGDIAFGRGRRYAAVEEYLQAGQVVKGETVVLLTDDVTAIEEVERYHRQDYNWVYLDRPRFRGAEGGFEGFIPSQDPALEILAIMAEIKMASQCHKLVHGKSGFVALIVEALENSGQAFEIVYLDTQQDKKQQEKMDPVDREKKYLQRIQERLDQQTTETA